MRVLTVVLLLCFGPATCLVAATAVAPPTAFPAVSEDALVDLPAVVSVALVPAGSLADEAGLIVGDGLLSVDGRRIVDGIGLHHLLRAGVNRSTGSTLHVRRQGQVVTLRVPAVLAVPDSLRGIAVQTAVPAWATVLQQWGVDASLVTGVERVPALMAVQLREWLQDAPTAQQRLWLQALLQRYQQLSASASAAPQAQGAWPKLQAAEQAPAWLQQLGTWYDYLLGLDGEQRLVLAMQHGQGDGLHARATASALIFLYPWPRHAALGIGKPRLDDARFLALVQARHRDPWQSWHERQSYAAEQRSRVIEQSDLRYLAHVRAALVHPQSALQSCLRDSGVWREASRLRMIEELTRRLAKGRDADLCAVALLAPLVYERRQEEVVVMLRYVQTSSPYLARLGMDIVRQACLVHDRGGRGLLMAIEKQMPGEAFKELRDPATEAMFRDPSLRMSQIRRGLSGLESAVAMAWHAGEVMDFLQFGDRDAYLAEWEAMQVNFNNMTWDLATDAALTDPKQAKLGVEQMIRHASYHMPAYQRDTVAAGFAKAGVFAAAVRWQLWTIVELEQAPGTQGNLRNLAEFRERLEVYRRQRPAIEVHRKVAKPSEEQWDDGKTVKAKGNRIEEQRAGPWQHWHANGKRAALGSWKEDRRQGFWQFFDEQGKPSMSGWLHNDARLGPWLAFRPGGSIAWRGHYLGEGEGLDQPIGTWRWYHPNGKVWLSADYHEGRRHGPCVIFDEAGQQQWSGTMVAGRPVGTWTKTLADGTRSEVAAVDVTLPALPNPPTQPIE